MNILYRKFKVKKIQSKFAYAIYLRSNHGYEYLSLTNKGKDKKKKKKIKNFFENFLPNFFKIFFS